MLSPGQSVEVDELSGSVDREMSLSRRALVQRVICAGAMQISSRKNESSVASNKGNKSNKSHCSRQIDDEQEQKVMLVDLKF